VFTIGVSNAQELCQRARSLSREPPGEDDSFVEASLTNRRPDNNNVPLIKNRISPNRNRRIRKLEASPSQTGTPDKSKVTLKKIKIYTPDL